MLIAGELLKEFSEQYIVKPGWCTLGVHIFGNVFMFYKVLWKISLCVLYQFTSFCLLMVLPPIHALCKSIASHIPSKVSKEKFSAKNVLTNGRALKLSHNVMF